jgi:hypothetical protein
MRTLLENVSYYLAMTSAASSTFEDDAPPRILETAIYIHNHGSLEAFYPPLLHSGPCHVSSLVVVLMSKGKGGIVELN